MTKCVPPMCRSGQCFLKAAMAGVVGGACVATQAHAPARAPAPAPAPAPFQAPGLHGINRAHACPGSALHRGPTALHDSQAPGALVLNSGQCQEGKDRGIVAVVVDPYICRHLRPHQRAGVQFLYDCVMGAREANCFGAVLADDMGLG
jgi:hypothetical protein